MTEAQQEELIELVFFKLGDPNRDGGMFAEIDNDLRNAFDEESQQTTLDNMRDSLHELRGQLNKAESALDQAILELRL